MKSTCRLPTLLQTCRALYDCPSWKNSASTTPQRIYRFRFIYAWNSAHNITKSYKKAQPSRKFPSFTATRPQHQRRTLQRRRTSHHQHHAERHRKHKEGNLPYLQPQRTTYHHRSKQKDYQLPRRHFQPKQQHLSALHKA